jgi:SHS2 domain-containing protein
MIVDARDNGGKLMGRAETFDHTADLGLRIRGIDLPDVFETSATALFDVIVANRDAVQVTVTEPVSLQAESTEELLVGWLNELIFRFETQHRLYARFDVILNDEGRALQGTLGGEPLDRDRHLLDHEVKAATRHGLSLRHENGGWVAEIILDI